MCLRACVRACVSVAVALKYWKAAAYMIYIWRVRYITKIGFVSYQDFVSESKSSDAVNIAYFTAYLSLPGGMTFVWRRIKEFPNRIYRKYWSFFRVIFASLDLSFLYLSLTIENAFPRRLGNLTRSDLVWPDHLDTSRCFPVSDGVACFFLHSRSS